MGDLWGLLWSYLYILAVVAVGEGASRRGLSRDLSRKIIHVGVGLWIIGTVTLFDNRYLAAIPAITAIGMNWFIHRRRLLTAVETEPENLGTVWFPVSFATLVLVAWDVKAAVVGGVLAMTLGDALASTVGMRWGRWQYETLGGNRKTVEGSLVMLVVTFVTVLETLWVFEAGRSTSWLAGLSLLAAVAATCAEALGEKGLDNLWVPLGAGLVIALGLQRIPADAVIPLGVGSLLAAVIGLLAWRRQSLTPSGVLGAILTGTILFGFGRWVGGLALVAFFVSSSLLSRQFRRLKQEVEADFAKTGTRDFSQAMANGGMAAVAAVAYGATGDVAWMGAVLGALAAANADTWATELGVLSKSLPRLITTFRPVAPGTSGAVSQAGSLAALSGALFVGLVAALTDPTWWRAVPAVALAGFAGAAFDSLLGATLQGVYWCPDCEKETERKVHRCGAATLRHRGLAFVNNDLVNLMATMAGALVGYLAL